AARARRAAPARDRAVEEITDTGDDDAHDGPQEVTGCNEHRSRDRGEQPEDRQSVGGNADPAQAPTERTQASLDAMAPASVEHARTPCSFSRAIGAWVIVRRATSARAREQFDGTTAIATTSAHAFCP